MPDPIRRTVTYASTKMEARGRHGYMAAKGLTFTLLKEDSRDPGFEPRVLVRVINKQGESVACCIEIPIDSLNEVAKMLRELHTEALKPQDGSE